MRGMSLEHPAVSRAQAWGYPEKRPGRAGLCQLCGSELEQEAYLFFTGGRERIICPECFDEEFEALSRRERAELVGARAI